MATLREIHDMFSEHGGPITQDDINSLIVLHRAVGVILDEAPDDSGDVCTYGIAVH